MAGREWIRFAIGSNADFRADPVGAAVDLKRRRVDRVLKRRSLETKLEGKNGEDVKVRARPPLKRGGGGGGGGRTLILSLM